MSYSDVCSSDGTLLAIRRVDGLVIGTHAAGSTLVQVMGFRLETDVFFQTRKVQ